MPALCTTKPNDDKSDCNMRLLWCKPRWKDEWCIVNIFDSHCAHYFRWEKPSQPLLYLPFKPHLKRDCSRSHFHKTGCKTCTVAALTTLRWSTTNHPSICPLWKILLCWCGQGIYNKGVGETPCYPAKAWCCSGYFQTARVLHHFLPCCKRRFSLMLHYHLLETEQAAVASSAVPAFSLSSLVFLAVTEIDFSVCHWWHCTIAVFKLAAAW